MLERSFWYVNDYRLSRRGNMIEPCEWRGFFAPTWSFARVQSVMDDLDSDRRWNLAVETSGRSGSVALGMGSTVEHILRFETQRNHSAELLPAVDRLCREISVDPRALGALFVSGGPGSFTGLRVGITFARAMALAGNLRIVRVPTLDIVAQNALEADDRPKYAGVVLDAKRHKVYAAAYVLRGERYERLADAAERDPVEFFESIPRPAAILGEGVGYIGQAVGDSGLRVLPEALHAARAEHVYRLGQALATSGVCNDACTLTPIYVRRPEAEEVWERRHGTDHA